MPSELQRVAKALLDALDEMHRIVPYLHDRARKYREAAGWVGSLSNNPQGQRAAVQLDDAARRCEEAAHYLSSASAKAHAWAEQMVSGQRTIESEPGSGAIRPDTGTTRPPGIGRDHGPAEPDVTKVGDPGAGETGTAARDWPAPTLDDKTARDLLTKLPVRRAQPGYREKTSGSWRDAQGNIHRLISGVDRYRELGDQFVVEHRLGDPPHTLSVTSHVEVKFALFMRDRGLTDETIVVNNAICDGRWSCEEMLKDFLPPGSRLVVYGPDGIGRPYYGKDGS